MSILKNALIAGVFLTSFYLMPDESRADSDGLVPVAGDIPFFVPGVKRYELGIGVAEVEPSVRFRVDNDSDRSISGRMTISVFNEAGGVRDRTWSRQIAANRHILQSWPFELDEGENRIEMIFSSASSGRVLGSASTSINYSPQPKVCEGPAVGRTSRLSGGRTVDLGNTGGTVRVSFRGTSSCLKNALNGEGAPCPSYTLEVTPANSSTPLVSRSFSGSNVVQTASFHFNPESLGTSHLSVRVRSSRNHVGEFYVTCPGGSLPSGSRDVSFRHWDSWNTMDYECPADLELAGRGLYSLQHNTARTFSLGLGGSAYKVRSSCVCRGTVCLKQPDPEIIITGGGGLISEETFGETEGVFFIGSDGRVRPVED